MPRSTTATVGTSRRKVSVNEALDGIGEEYRCFECRQRVRPHRQGRNGQAAHFEHLRRNANCRLSDPKR